MLSRPPVEGNTCNLDCLRKNPVRTFDGPVKIVLVDIPRKEYCKRIWWAGLIGLSYLLIGYTSITMILFSSSWTVNNLYNNLHILLCTVGFQLLMPLGILMTLNLNGPSAPMKPSGRKINHVVMQMFAFIFNTTGSILILILGDLDKDKWPTILVNSIHCFFGMIALFISGLAVMIGPMIFCKSSCSQGFKNLHACLGLSAYFCSSICFIYSFYKTIFIKWDPLHLQMSYMTSIFVCIYTAIVITYPAYTLMCTNMSATKDKNVFFK